MTAPECSGAEWGNPTSQPCPSLHLLCLFLHSSHICARRGQENTFSAHLTRALWGSNEVGILRCFLTYEDSTNISHTILYSVGGREWVLEGAVRRQGVKESTDPLSPESGDPVLTPTSSQQPVLSWFALHGPRTAFPLCSVFLLALHSCCK